MLHQRIARAFAATTRCNHTTNLALRSSLSRVHCLSQGRAGYATMHSQLSAEYRTVYNTARAFAENRLMRVAAEIDRNQEIPPQV